MSRISPKEFSNIISTVTTTVSTVVSTTTGAQLVISLGLAAVLTLIIAAAAKQLATAGGGTVSRLLSHRLDVIILPLFFVLIFMVAIRIINLLG